MHAKGYVKGSNFPNGNFERKPKFGNGYICLQQMPFGMGVDTLTSKPAKILIGVIVTAILAFVLGKHAKEIRQEVVDRDSIAYWCAGNLLVHGQNPYEVSTVLAMEQQRGYSHDKPLILRTPPWSLFLVMPLGFLSPFGAWALWTAMSFGSLLAAMRICWKLYRADVPRNLFSIVGYTFAPVPACLVAGQMGLVLLLGMMLFLRWEEERPFWAGVALILPFAKPHLLSLFWFALVLLLVRGNRRRVAFGFAVSMTLVTGVALIFDPHVFQHYRTMLDQAAIGYEFIPALSGILRLIFFRSEFWAQFVPMALGLIWCSWFVRRNRFNWEWRQHAPVLLVASVLTTPYAWLTDEVVVLPAVLQASAWAYASRGHMTVGDRVALVTAALLNGLLLLILRSKVPFSTGIYFWSSLVWFSWYLYSRRRWLVCEQSAPGA